MGTALVRRGYRGARRSSRMPLEQMCLPTFESEDLPLYSRSARTVTDKPCGWQNKDKIAVVEVSIYHCSAEPIKHQQDVEVGDCIQFLFTVLFC